MRNSLQTVLDRANKQEIKPVKDTVKQPRTTRKNTAQKTTAKARDKTVLIGGHFPPQVAKQLKILAAEEETTNQALLEEALNLLFAKKGKASIRV